MSSFESHVAQIEVILGVKISDDGVLDFNVKCDHSSEEDRKRCLSDIRLKQKALGMVKRDISHTIKNITHEYQDQNASVGKGIGSFFATMFAGSRAVGRYNALARSDIRNKKIDRTEPYRKLKAAVDQILYELDRVKHKIEFDRK